MHKLGRKKPNIIWKHTFIVGIIVVVFVVILGIVVVLIVIVDIDSIDVVFSVCSITAFNVVDNQWVCATMLPITVVGLQAPLILTYVVLLLFNLQ
jgi:hypothetical protein